MQRSRRIISFSRSSPKRTNVDVPLTTPSRSTLITEPKPSLRNSSAFLESALNVRKASYSARTA
ncbi:MAG: hypothetical protein IPL24_12745 [Bacteroidetes bacterium]|nr:hypothetical protein [Bacteroidota bacterium]